MGLWKKMRPERQKRRRNNRERFHSLRRSRFRLGRERDFSFRVFFIPPRVRYTVSMLLQSAMVGKYFFGEWLGDLLRFPYWWYTRGLAGVGRWIARAWQNQWRAYAIGLWMRSFFIPMYGQYDWTGRILSVCIRLVVLLARLFVLSALAALGAIGVLVWIALPPAAFFLFIINLLQAMDSGAAVALIRAYAV